MRAAISFCGTPSTRCRRNTVRTGSGSEAIAACAKAGKTVKFLYHRGLREPQALVGRRRPLGIAAIRAVPGHRLIEFGEGAQFEAHPPRPVDREVAHHARDIRRVRRDSVRGRLGDEAQHDVLHDVLGERLAVQDAPRGGDVSGLVRIERTESARVGQRVRKRLRHVPAARARRRLLRFR